MIFNSFWYGNKLPLSAAACMASFVKAGHEYRLYTYGPLKVPRGVQLRDARDVLAEDEIFLDVKRDGSVGNIAAFSDLFRYVLLRRFGGWWVDTDVLCVGGPIPETELYFGWEDGDFINGAILKTPPDHALVRRLEQRAREIGRGPKRGEMGPRLVTEVIRELGLAGAALPREVVYPVHYEDYLMLVTADDAATARKAVANATFVHLWNEMFSGEGSPLLRVPERGSYMSSVYRETLPLHQYMTIWWQQTKRGAPARVRDAART